MSEACFIIGVHVCKGIPELLKRLPENFTYSSEEHLKDYVLKNYQVDVWFLSNSLYLGSPVSLLKVDRGSPNVSYPPDLLCSSIISDALQMEKRLLSLGYTLKDIRVHIYNEDQ